MKKIGFSERWLYLINQCISTVLYSILLNGYPGDPFSPQRGLRQSDPLSSYLFVICAEGLSTLLQKAKLEQKIAGIGVCRATPKVCHLFFRDDTLIFLKPI